MKRLVMIGAVLAVVLGLLPNIISVAEASGHKTLICHHNPDEDDGDPEWVVIEVATNSVAYHIANHGDYTDPPGVVGDACTAP